MTGLPLLSSASEVYVPTFPALSRVTMLSSPPVQLTSLQWASFRAPLLLSQ